MKYYTLEEIIKVIEKLLEHGWGEVDVFVEAHKLLRYKYIESHKPEEKEDASRLP